VTSLNSSSDTITLSASAAGYTSISAVTYTGLNALDGAGTQGTGDGISIASGNYTVTQYDLNVGLIFGETLSSGSGWNLRASDTNGGTSPYSMIEESTDSISSGGGLLGVYSGLSPVLIANNTVLGGGTGSALCFGANQTMTGVTLENNVFSTCNQLTDISHVTFTAFNYKRLRGCAEQ